MDITVEGHICGSVTPPGSKSLTHRHMIAAALSQGTTVVNGCGICDDTLRTADCISALGAVTEICGDTVTIHGAAKRGMSAVLDCGESGTTLRFMLPVAAALGTDARFIRRGRLASRPLSPLDSQLSAHGAVTGTDSNGLLSCSGSLSAEDFRIPGDISSQFISGLMLALSAMRERGAIHVEGALRSAPYVTLTADVLREYSVFTSVSGSAISLSGTLSSPGIARVEADWSSAAFWAVASAVSARPVTVCGVRAGSSQGDAAVCRILERMGRTVDVSEAGITVIPGPLRGCEIDASDIPDLVPILAVAAARASGPTRFTGTSRLRLKESDRVEAVESMLAGFGISTTSDADSLTVIPWNRPHAGDIDSFSDHRIAMSAAVMALTVEGPTHIRGAECVSKSYPGFFSELARLGAAAVKQ